MPLAALCSVCVPCKVLSPRVRLRAGLVARISLLAACVLGGSTAAWGAGAVTSTSLGVTSGGSPVTTVTSGSVVTLTATVTASGAAVTPGTVKFCDAAATYCEDIHILGTAQLTTGGTATMKFIPGIGTHSYKAVFVGTGTYTTSTSSSSAVTVTGAIPASTTTIAQSGSPGNYNLAATVTGAGTAFPTGTISFLDASDSNAVLGTASLVAGTSARTFTVSSSPTASSGPYSVAVGDFNGDGKQELAM